MNPRVRTACRACEDRPGRGRAGAACSVVSWGRVDSLVDRDAMCRREEPPRYESGFRAHGSNQRFHRLLRHAVARALTTAPSLAGVSPAAPRILILHRWRRKPPETLSCESPRGRGKSRQRSHSPSRPAQTSLRLRSGTGLGARRFVPAHRFSPLKGGRQAGTARCRSNACCCLAPLKFVIAVERGLSVLRGTGSSALVPALVAVDEDCRPLSRAIPLERGEEGFRRPDEGFIDVDIPLTATTLPS